MKPGELYLFGALAGVFGFGLVVASLMLPITADGVEIARIAALNLRLLLGVIGSGLVITASIFFASGAIVGAFTAKS